MNSRVKNLIFWVVVGLFMILLFNLFTFQGQSPDEEVKFSEFVSKVEQSDVREVTIRTSLCSTLLTNSLNLTSSSGDCPWKVKRLNNRIMNRPTTTQKMRFFTREFILTPKNHVHPNIPPAGTQYARSYTGSPSSLTFSSTAR